jgi:hypothetical protein
VPLDGFAESIGINGTTLEDSEFPGQEGNEVSKTALYDNSPTKITWTGQRLISRRLDGAGCQNTPGSR